MRMATRLRRWTLSDLARLPDDGNRYEVIRGELFVTPGVTSVRSAIFISPLALANTGSSIRRREASWFIARVRLRCVLSRRSYGIPSPGRNRWA